MGTRLNPCAWGQQIYQNMAPRPQENEKQKVANQEKLQPLVPTEGVRPTNELKPHSFWIRTWSVLTLALIMAKLAMQPQDKLVLAQPGLPALPVQDPLNPSQAGFKRKVQFQDFPTKVSMPNGAKIQLDRQAYNDMRLQQYELHQSMLRLSNRYFNSNDVKHAVYAYALIKDAEKALLDEVGRQLRQANNPEKRLTKTPVEFANMLTDLDNTLGVIDEHLDQAQKNNKSWWRKWVPVSPDPDVEKARACFENYRVAISQLYSQVKSVSSVDVD